MPDIYSAQDILPLSFRGRDGQDRLDNDFENKIWVTNKKTKTLGQQLGRQVSVRFSIDLPEEVDTVVFIPATNCIDEILIEEDVELAMKFARKKL